MGSWKLRVKPGSDINVYVFPNQKWKWIARRVAARRDAPANKKQRQASKASKACVSRFPRELSQQVDPPNPIRKNMDACNLGRLMLLWCWCGVVSSMWCWCDVLSSMWCQCDVMLMQCDVIDVVSMWCWCGAMWCWCSVMSSMWCRCGVEVIVVTTKDAKYFVVAQRKECAERSAGGHALGIWSGE